ncbi:MAG: prepilin-type N-terminal cleavage/methylation domain-containing protein [Limnobacter sp.]|nr:prepilin-type N-terminal cleavage/methylation domain-containing protein [Limnobacter sp.]
MKLSHDYARKHRTAARGFTLLEVLIALGIVAVISLLSWRGLEEVLRMSSRLQGVDEQLQNTIAMFNQLEKDLQTVELGANDPQKPKDEIRLTEDGLFLLGTQRSSNAVSTASPGDMGQQLRLFWTWKAGQIQRSSQLVAPEGEVPVVFSDPLPLPGLALRLWIEGVGWTQAQQQGELRMGFSTPPILAGRPNPLNPALIPKQAGAGGEAGAGGGGSETTGTEEAPAGQTRMLQVLATLPNGQTVSRIFEVGGLY